MKLRFEFSTSSVPGWYLPDPQFVYPIPDDSSNADEPFDEWSWVINYLRYGEEHPYP